MMAPDWLRLLARRFWSMATFKYSLVVVLLWWAIVFQQEYRVPGRLILSLLPWLGIVLGVLNLTFLLNHLWARAPGDDAFRETFRRAEEWATYPVLAFICYSIFLYGNGNLAGSTPQYHKATVLSVGRAGHNLGLPLHYEWLELTSWRTPGETEYLLASRVEEGTFSAGEAVIVEVSGGNLGVPWVSKVKRDQEHYARAVLAVAPEASLAWKTLIWFYLDHWRWDEAREATLSYLEVYPRDANYGNHAAGMLWLNGQISGAEAVLDRVVAGRPSTWHTYKLMADLYMGVGKLEKALPLYEKTLELRPGYPQAEGAIQTIRKQLAIRRASAADR